jgi:hypothetical protein
LYFGIGFLVKEPSQLNRREYLSNRRRAGEK